MSIFEEYGAFKGGGGAKIILACLRDDMFLWTN